jgi:hypothetical protein
MSGQSILQFQAHICLLYVHRNGDEIFINEEISHQVKDPAKCRHASRVTWNQESLCWRGPVAI